MGLETKFKFGVVVKLQCKIRLAAQLGRFGVVVQSLLCNWGDAINW